MKRHSIRPAYQDFSLLVNIASIALSEIWNMVTVKPLLADPPYIVRTPSLERTVPLPPIELPIMCLLRCFGEDASERELRGHLRGRQRANLPPKADMD